MKRKAPITDTESAKAQRLESVATRVPRQYGHHGVYDDWRDRGLGSLGSGGLLDLPNDVLGRIEGYVDPRPKGPRPPAVKVPSRLVSDSIYSNWNYEIPPRDRVFTNKAPALTTFLDQVRIASGDAQWLERATGGRPMSLGQLVQVMFERRTEASDNTLASDMYEEGRRNLQVI